MQCFCLCVQVSIPLINPKKQAKKKSYTNSGVLLISSCKVSSQSEENKVMTGKKEEGDETEGVLF